MVWRERDEGEKLLAAVKMDVRETERQETACVSEQRNRRNINL